MLDWLKRLFRPPRPAGPAVSVRRFGVSDATLAEDGISVEDEAWCIDAARGARASARTLRLFEIEQPGLELCLVTYRASMRCEDLEGRAFLEMWCRLEGQGEFFSKGFDQALSGTSGWASYEIPFWLKRGQRPDLIKLNVTLEGGGRLWLKDVELLQTPLTG